MKRLTFLLVIMIACTQGKAQDTSKPGKLILLPGKLFTVLDKKSNGIETKLEKRTRHYLSKLQKEEHCLKEKLLKKDSLLAERIFGDIDKYYAELRKFTGNISEPSSVYSGHLDSLSTCFAFLKEYKLDKPLSDSAIRKSLSQYKRLQSGFNASDQINKVLNQRQAILNEQFQSQGTIRVLKQFRKQVYYYKVQVREYKELFEDASKMEEKLIELVMSHPQFKAFFANHSMLATLFALPGSAPLAGDASVGLQTREVFNQSIIGRFGSGPDLAAKMRPNFQSAQEQLTGLQNKLGAHSSGSPGNGDASELPNFKPNDQKTKSFLKRLEYGANIQSQKARYFFPVTSDIAFSVGYRLNDRSSIGIGASYKLGWGSGWNHLSVTHQGIGLRSYIDWEIRGSFYISGGYEQNYRSMMREFDQLKDQSAWQQSGLLGLSKKYKLNRKMKGEMKILWDFLSYQQVPVAQPIVFRIGYDLK